MSHHVLPETLKRIVETCGIDAAIQLSASLERRGRRCPKIYIPKRMTREHWIVQTIGDSAASALWGAFAGELISIAGPQAFFRFRRDWAIREQARRLGVAPVALSFGLSQRRVRSIAGTRRRERGGAACS